MEGLKTREEKVVRLALEKMREIIKATVEGSYVFTSEEVWRVLVKKGFVEVKSEIVNERGEVATRATISGIKSFPNGEKEVMPEEKPVYVIENIAVTPAKRVRVGKGSIYPFAVLTLGQSFFVPATADRPMPWKSMASTVGTATRRYAVLLTNDDGSRKMRPISKGPKKGELVQDTENTRIFIISKDEKDGIAGARIGRTA